MSITPRGMSIQEAYRLYRDEKFLINRRYQRKLVWTEEEKAKLIDSILKGFPIPLILLAQSNGVAGEAYEIIDGMQRLHAISAFIENKFPLLDGRYFDVSEFARAKQASEMKMFKTVGSEQPKLTPLECANLLDYQLAVTIYPTTDATQITEVFGRINSGGRQLSPQERRQAGVVTPFAEMVRRIASELRGDSSPEILRLQNMPEISIGSKSSNQDYGLRAEDTFWCRQGIFWTSSLRSSEDEEMIADIAASILFGSPFAKSMEELDDLYDPTHESFEKVERTLASYGGERLAEEIKTTFSVLRETITSYSDDANALRKVVSGIRNELKTPFYAIFMAFFELLVRQEKSPSDPAAIMKALKGINKDMTRSRHYTLPSDREKNINKIIGLIQKHFVTKEPPALRHGPGLALDFENSLRRSSIETPRYEFKQGLLKLDAGRAPDENLPEKLINTMCGIANLGPEQQGFIYIGVADKDQDAKRIGSLDSLNPIQIGKHYVVGVDRELKHLRCTLEHYVNRLLTAVRGSQLSEPLKSQILTNIDTVEYRSLSVVRFCIPAQNQPSYVGSKIFVREGSNTIEALGPKAYAVFQKFQR